MAKVANQKKQKFPMIYYVFGSLIDEKDRWRMRASRSLLPQLGKVLKEGRTAKRERERESRNLLWSGTSGGPFSFYFHIYVLHPSPFFFCFLYQLFLPLNKKPKILCNNVLFITWRICYLIIWLEKFLNYCVQV